MTLIRLSDIREGDVHPDAGMSNIPWEYEYGFQREADLLDDQCTVLQDLFGFDPESSDEELLDGLSPDASGTFNTDVYVRRKDGSVRVVCYNRLQLIKLANKILLGAAVEIAFAVQRETLLPGPNLLVDYQMCPDAGVTKAIIVGDLAFPLSQMLSLRGYEGIGKLQWVDPPDEC